MAKLAREAGGFQTSSSLPLMRAQVQIVDVEDPFNARLSLLSRKDEIIELANRKDQLLNSLGGGCRDIEVHTFAQSPRGPMLVGKTTQVSTAGTMAANAEATSLQAGLAAFASTAAIPIIGPIAAPGAMAAALAVTQPLAAAVGMTAMAGAGFMKGGFTGFGANDEVAGPVHRNEFVMDAEATARIGVGRLEALSDGRMSIMGSGGGSPSTAPAPGRESSSKGLTVNLIEDRSRAGQSERGTNSDGSEYLNLWAAQIRAGGNDTSDSLEAAYGLQRQAL